MAASLSDRPDAVRYVRAAVDLDYRILGPLEVLVDGRAAPLGGPRQRAVLAVLLAHAGEMVPATRLIDEVWDDAPPDTAAKVLQGYVSGLRKALGRDAIATRGRGYAVAVPDGALDLQRFERHAAAGGAAADAGRMDEAAREFRAALALWRGPALADLADEAFARGVAGRLDELRLAATERAIESELACGHHRELVAELEGLVAAHPLRERVRGLQMLALYRCGRQADALEAFRAARATLVDELGIEPGAQLQELERAILRQDAALDPEPAPAAAAAPAAETARAVLAVALDAAAIPRLAAIGAALATRPGFELVLAAAVPGRDELGDATERLVQERATLEQTGPAPRVAAFTSASPGEDVARLAREQEADVLLVDAPGGLLDDPRLLSLLEEAPCDVAVVAGARVPAAAPVLVPFSGAEHDWAAVELGAWLAGALEGSLLLAGASTGAAGRDASRLLASAALAVQRTLGIAAEPVIVDPEPEAVLAETSRAGAVIIGLTERWRREGLGRTRSLLATDGPVPTLLVRRGLRPGGLASRADATRFTWTLGPG